ncbi:hypothetical protein APTSU1_001863300 [Apodemus speciosus]|uniref:C2H2-type domain-containing protein n=1 Tax=Apodemus speciosus TaxID=105296 RepID=A0ABQ0FVV9_APOSI
MISKTIKIIILKKPYECNHCCEAFGNHNNLLEHNPSGRGTLPRYLPS